MPEVHRPLLVAGRIAARFPRELVEIVNRQSSIVNQEIISFLAT
jgi:hypothetical protein